jgi:hypothetical protein
VPLRGALLVALAALLALPAAATAKSGAPGDSYLNAFRLNPGPRDNPQPIPAAGASFSANTSSYGIEGDTGGVREPNRCSPTLYGKTAWAWLRTRKWGQADVRAAAAFDPVLAVMPFTSPNRPELSPQSGACVNRSTTGNEDFGDDRPILAPGWYAIQVGGAENAAGQPAGGTVQVVAKLSEPPRITARVRTSSRRRGRAAAVSLRARAPRGSRVSFACRRKKCRLPGRRTVEQSGTRRYLRGRSVPNGARLELRITRPGHIGAYFAWDIRRGRLGRVRQRCMEPASPRPRARCDG